VKNESKNSISSSITNHFAKSNHFFRMFSFFTQSAKMPAPASHRFIHALCWPARACEPGCSK
jgi:hypothetical protein